MVNTEKLFVMEFALGGTDSLSSFIFPFRPAHIFPSPSALSFLCVCNYNFHIMENKVDEFVQDD